MAGVYVDVGDVTPRLGGRAIDANTSPTATEVVEWIEEAEGELLGTLDAVGIPSTYSSGTRGFQLIRGWVSKYVAGLVQVAHAARDGIAAETSREDLELAWKEHLRFLELNPARTSAMLGGSPAASSSVGIGSHVLTQADEERKPIFRVRDYHL